MLDKKSLKQNKGFKIQLKKRLLKSFCKDNVGEYGRIRQLSKDNRGNYSIIISAILIISFLILSIALLNSSLEENESNKDAISSNQIIQTSNILKSEETNYLEIMREGMFNEINLIRKNESHLYFSFIIYTNFFIPMYII